MKSPFPKLFLRQMLNPCFILLACLITLCESCDLMKMYAEGSFDLAHEKYDDPGTPSYNSPNADEVGFDLACVFLVGTMAGSTQNLGQKNGAAFNDFSIPPGKDISSFQSPAYPGHGMNGFEPTDFDFNKFKEKLNLMSGLQLISKRSNDGGLEKITLNYLQIPSYVVYSTQAGSGEFVGGLGPYFAYGLGGKTKKASSKFSSFDKTLGFKRFDAGLGIMAGYHFQNDLMVNLGYSWGVVNVSRDEFERARIRTLTFNAMYPLNKIMQTLKK